MDESLYGDMLGITEEIEALLGQEGNEERLAALLTRRQEMFSRLGDTPLDEELAVLVRRIRVSEDRCMALARDKMAEIQDDLAGMNKGKLARAAYGKHV